VDLFDRVIALDNLHPQVHRRKERPSRLHGKVELVQGDITDASAWARVLDDSHPSTVIHLAAETGTGQSLAAASRHAGVNVLGTAMMLDALAARRIRPSRLVLASSRAVYGEGTWLRDGAEYQPEQRSLSQLQSQMWDFADSTSLPMEAMRTMPKPVSVYGVTKLSQEQLVRVWADSYDVPTSVLRLQNVYGPGQSPINAYTGIAVIFARLAREGKVIPVFEDGKMMRDFIHVADVAGAICKAVTASSRDHHLLDIGTGSVVTVEELAQMIAGKYEAPRPRVSGEFRVGDVRHARADPTRACQTLSWMPRRELRQGVDELCDWLKDEELI
jgi:dTDP-L-rhamnose 4-epimerase